LYGLKSAPKQWNKTFTAWATKDGEFVQSSFDPCLFFHRDYPAALVIYVDDLLIGAATEEVMMSISDTLEKQFQMRMMGEPSMFLGMELKHDKRARVLHMTQTQYIESLTEKYNVNHLSPKRLPMDPALALEKLADGELPTSNPYSSLVGALMFLSVCTRPDITFVVHKLAQYMSNPSQQHWDTAILVLRYLKGTKDMGIQLGKFGNPREIVAYSDSDWGGDLDDRRSVSGGFFVWWGSPVAWYARKQSMISTSSTEAEILAMVEASETLVFVKRLVSESLNFLRIGDVPSTVLLADNQPGIDAVANGKARNKHYSIKVLYLAECIDRRLFQINKVATKDNIADIFTKPLRSVRMAELLRGVMIGRKANSFS
jgi:hypothetical protein